MKKYKLELNEKEKRLIEALLCNEEYHYQKSNCPETFDNDYEMLELIKGILVKIEAEEE